MTTTSETKTSGAKTAAQSGKGADCADCEKCHERCTDKVEFLQGLPEDKHLTIMRRSQHYTLEKDSFLFEEGDEVDGLFIILRGRVKLSSLDGEGREKIAGIFSDHDTIWEGIFLHGSVYPYSAVCLTETRVCKIYRRDFEEVIRDADIALKVIGMLSRKLHDANERNLILGTSEPKARLAGLLLYRKERSEDRFVTLRLDDIAASVNLRPETVSRKLGELEREGLIRKQGQSSWEILDYEGLRDMFDH